MNNTVLEKLLGAWGPGLEGRKRAARCTDVYALAARSSDKQEDLNFSNWGLLVLPDEQKG